MQREKFTPQAGLEYRNQGGGVFCCLHAGYKDGEGVMQNVKSLWTLTAHGCGIYEDGTIDWDYSTNGHFAEN